MMAMMALIVWPQDEITRSCFIDIFISTRSSNLLITIHCDSWKEIFFSWVCCSHLGQLVGADCKLVGWTRVQSTTVYQLGWLFISFTLYHLDQPREPYEETKPWPHLVISAHSHPSKSNWIKKLLWRNSGAPLVSWKLILLTEMSGTGLSWGEVSSQVSILSWFDLIW